MLLLLRTAGILSSSDRGSWTQLFAVAGDEFTPEMSGEYLEPIAKKGDVSVYGNQADLAEKLWNWTEAEMKSKGCI